MRKALMISLAFHLGLSIVIFQWVAFQQVKYVPRDVYSVRLVAAAAPSAARVTASLPAPSPPKPEPVEKEEEEDQMPPPPEQTKKKPDSKTKKPQDKVVPSTDVRKTDATADSLYGAGPGGGAGDMPVAGGVRFDGGDFPFGPFVSRMRQKIAAAWEVPAGTAGVERSAVVYFRAHRDGGVSHVAVEQSSGVPLFDRSCQRAVLQAAPLPPLPREYKDEYVGVHFSFQYVPTP